MLGRTVVDEVANPKLPNYKVAASAAGYLAIAALISRYACGTSMSLLLASGMIFYSAQAANQVSGGKLYNKMLSFFAQQPETPEKPVMQMEQQQPAPSGP